MFRKSCLLSGLALLLLCGLFCWQPALAREGGDGERDPGVERDRGDRAGKERAGERAKERGDEPRAEERGDEEQAERRKMLQRATELWRRMRNGEELTQEEKRLVNKVREMNARRRKEIEERQRRERLRNAPVPLAPLAKPGQAGERRLRHDERLNVVDAAYFQIAELRLDQKKYDEAVAALNRLVEKSPDKFAVSLAHFNLAALYHRELANRQKAIEEYKKVTGELALDALRRLAELFEELEQIDEAVEQFEAVAKSAADNTQKVLALRLLADLLARHGRPDEAVAALQRLIRAVSYDEAAKISQALLAEQKRREKRELEEQERARLRMIKAVQDRWRHRKPQVQVELRPARVRPRGRKDEDKAAPRERPIRGDADREGGEGPHEEVEKRIE